MDEWSKLLGNKSHVLTPEWSTGGGDASFLGMRITLKNQDPSDPDPLSLFLPADGYITPENENAGTGLGYYWSSGYIDADGYYAYCMILDPDPSREWPYILNSPMSTSSRLLVRYIIDE